MQVPEVVAVGRVSVDLYARELDAGFADQQSFRKSIGGSPTNVAVAAARLGRRSAIVTKVGADALGEYVRHRLADFGVLTDYVGVQPGGQTPLALAALDPPESPQVAFYRGPAAPDTQLQPTDLPDDVVRGCGVLWMSQGALAAGPTATTAMTWLASRAKCGPTILDLDYRPALWPGIEAARAPGRSGDRLGHRGGRQSRRMRDGRCQSPIPTRRLTDSSLAVSSLAIIKQGGDGALFATGDRRWVVAPTRCRGRLRPRGGRCLRRCPGARTARRLEPC